MATTRFHSYSLELHELPPIARRRLHTNAPKMNDDDTGVDEANLPVKDPNGASSSVHLAH